MHLKTDFSLMAGSEKRLRTSSGALSLISTVLVQGPLHLLQEISASLGLHLSQTVLPQEVMNNFRKDEDMQILQ